MTSTVRSTARCSRVATVTGTILGAVDLCRPLRPFVSASGRRGQEQRSAQRSPRDFRSQNRHDYDSRILDFFVVAKTASKSFT